MSDVPADVAADVTADVSVDVKWSPVGALAELWEDEMQSVEVDGEDVLLVHRPAGVVHAFQGMCPHQEQLLIEGFMEDGVLVCSSHLWEFDCESGAGINPTSASLYRYPCRVVDGEIHVGVPQDGQRHFNRGS